MHHHHHLRAASHRHMADGDVHADVIAASQHPWLTAAPPFPPLIRAD